MLKKIVTELATMDQDLNLFPSIDQDMVIKFINDLKKLLFSHIYQTKIKIEDLYDLLNRILNQVVKNHQLITDLFFNQLIEIKKILLTDVQAFYEKDPAVNRKAEIVFTYNSFNAIYIYRIAHILDQLEVPIIPRIITEYAHSISGIDIHPKANIGNSFFIDHGTGIVIGETTVIGNSVSIYQGVTLGALSTKDAKSLKNCKRHPTILDNVVIYANTTILGGKTVIGNNCVIGASCFIVKSVADNSVITLKNQ